MKTGLVGALLLALPLLAAAQGKGGGELWEITMAIPGMPAGMMKPQRVCQGDDPSRAATQDPSKKDCKVTGSKKTALGTHVVLSCPDGSTMTIDQQFTSAARTEFKSTMTSKGGREGAFTMNMTGRKVGACDAVAENKARDAKIDDMKKQVAAGQAQSAAMMKEMNDKQVKQCDEASATMNWHGFGQHSQCYKKMQTEQCKSLGQFQAGAVKACSVKIDEYCKRYQTADGFMKAKADEAAAQMCGVSTKAIKTAQCPKTQNLAFLGAYCPVQAKPIAMEHCGGRDYTSKLGGKYAAFCANYLANADFEQPPGAVRPAAAAKPASGTTQEAPAQKGSATDQVKEGVSKGLDKIKGLFGR
jgi:hypothetical protein